MKEFKDCGNQLCNYTYTIDVINIAQCPYLRIVKRVDGINGFSTDTMDLSIIDILHMVEPEVVALGDCIYNQLADLQGCVTETYDMKNHELGLYLSPIISLFHYTRNNLMVELVYDCNEDGRYRLRKVDILNNLVTGNMTLSRDAAGFIMDTIERFYEKNKGKV